METNGFSTKPTKGDRPFAGAWRSRIVATCAQVFAACFVKAKGSTPEELLGPPVVPFYPFLGEGSPTNIDDRQKGTLFLTSLLKDLVLECFSLGWSIQNNPALVAEAQACWLVLLFIHLKQVKALSFLSSTRHWWLCVILQAAMLFKNSQTTYLRIYPRQYSHVFGYLHIYVEHYYNVTCNTHTYI